MGAIGAFFGKMFGTEKAVLSVVDGVKSGLDALVYTDEEKANDAAKDRAAARSMFITWIDKSQGQNIARRFLAMVIAFTWLSQYFLTGIFNVSAIWIEDEKMRNQMVLTAKITGENADGMTGAMMLILGFYFAAPHLGKMVDGAMARFGRATNVPSA